MIRGPDMLAALIIELAAHAVHGARLAGNLPCLGPAGPIALATSCRHRRIADDTSPWMGYGYGRAPHNPSSVSPIEARGHGIERSLHVGPRLVGELFSNFPEVIDALALQHLR